MLEKVKSYLIIEDSEEDLLLIDLMNAAHSSLQRAGVVKSDDGLYELAVCMLVCHWYEHRDEQGTFPHGVINIITQLKYTQESYDKSYET